MQRFIREQTRIEFYLNTGSTITGRVRWFDDQAYSIVPDGEPSITILRSAVVGYRAYSAEDEAAQAAGQVASQQPPPAATS